MAKLPNIIEREKGLLATMVWALSFAYKYMKKEFFALLVLTIITAIFSFLNIISFSKIIDLLGTKNISFSEILPYLALLFATEYLPPVIGYIKSYFDGVVSRDVREILEELRYKKTSSLDIATLEQPEFHDLLTKANRGIVSVGSLIDFSFNIIRDTAFFVIASVILIKVLPAGFLIVFLTLIPTFLFEHYSSKEMFKLWEMQIATNRSISVRSNPLLNKIGLIEIKFYDAAKYLIDKISELRKGKNDATNKFSRKRVSFFTGTVALAQVGSITVIGWVIFQVIQGVTTLGSLTLIWGTISRFSKATEALFRSFGRISEHQAHALKFYSLLKMDSYINENTGSVVFNGVPPKIEFKNVSFSYPDTDKIILNNISFIIQSKEEVAVVGLNGAGKTTLLRLLTRVYDPTEGQIFINDIPLSEYYLESWRKGLSIMNQDYRIFDEETIKENIVFDAKVNNEYLQQVINESDVDSYIHDYKDGVDQLIGKEFLGGVELSKGQNQKMILARTLYRNASLIILDEPTAAIDALSEDKIFKALRNNHKEQTRVIISHKFSNVRDADKIILIEHGQIIEQGNHDQLMKIKKGKYKELFELQAEGYK